MRITKVKNPEARRFLRFFFEHRKINREFYQRVPECKFDFRMVNTSSRKSDSPKESLIHQIIIQKTYMRAIKTGKLKYGDYNYQKLMSKSKGNLLEKLAKADQELVTLLTNEKNLKKKIAVPWSKKRINPIQMLWGLQEHEILHTGWNLALMDHLSIERFPAIKKLWG